MTETNTEILKKALRPTDLAQYVALLGRIQDKKILTSAQQQKLEAYEELIDRARAGEDPHHLPNLLAVHRWLILHGYKVSQSGFYKGAPGKLAPTASGSYSIKAVERYAQLHLTPGSKPTPADPQGDADQELQRARNRAETQRATEQAEHWKIRNKIALGEYAPLEAFERAHAARAMLLKSDAENWRHAAAPDIIELVHGEPALLPDLLEFLRCAHETWFARYDEDREFTVQFTPAPIAQALPVDEPTAEATE